MLLWGAMSITMECPINTLNGGPLPASRPLNKQSVSD